MSIHIVRKLLALLVLFTLSSLLFAQEQYTSYKLKRLGVKSYQLYDIMGGVDAYIGSKPKGFMFPMTKLVFSNYNGRLSVDVIGIDNSWTNLFGNGESPIGYCIIYNRLFILSTDKIENFPTTDLFDVYEDEKSFTLPPSEFQRPNIHNPSWFYDFNLIAFSLVGVRNLDALE